MNMDVQQRRPRRFDAAAQRGFDVIDVVEPLGAVQIDDQMHASAANAVAGGKMIEAIVLGRRRRHFQFRLPVFLSGGTWDPQALHRSQEGVLAHAVLPNQNKNPRCRRTGATESESRSISPHEQTNSGEFPT